MPKLFGGHAIRSPPFKKLNQPKWVQEIGINWKLGRATWDKVYTTAYEGDELYSEVCSKISTPWRKEVKKLHVNNKNARFLLIWKSQEDHMTENSPEVYQLNSEVRVILEEGSYKDFRDIFHENLLKIDILNKTEQSFFLEFDKERDTERMKLYELLNYSEENNNVEKNTEEKTKPDAILQDSYENVKIEHLLSSSSSLQGTKLTYGLTKNSKDSGIGSHASPERAEDRFARGTLRRMSSKRMKRNNLRKAYSEDQLDEEDVFY